MSSKAITSTDWHLEGVSVEVRRQIAAYAQLCGAKQGEVVDQMLREGLERKMPGIAWHKGDFIAQVGTRDDLPVLRTSSPIEPSQPPTPKAPENN